MEGYYKALADHGIETKENGVIFCTNNEEENYEIIKKLINNSNCPDGLIASVEKLTITAYHVCSDLQLQIPQDIKVISFSNLASALILNPSLTTITQPAFEIGNAAASLLFNALDKRNYTLKSENVILPSVLNVRNSTGFASAELSE
jgi:LacI family transcriptional regulator